MQASVNKDEKKDILHRPRLWLWLSIVAALLAIAGNIIALSVGSIYAPLTPVFFPQALAQDIASLAVVSPAWLILAALALRGSLRAYLQWLGVLTFTIYNYVIYTFSVPFGPLLPLWIVVFGLSLYALIGGIATADHKTIQRAYTSERAIRVVGWFLVVAGVLFTLLWLSEDVPAWLAGKMPQSLIDMGLPTNPVHILDLSFFLPAIWITAALLLKHRALAYTLAPAFIVFIILTGIPILITPIVQAQRGETAGWGVMVPVGTLTAISLALLVWFIMTIRAQRYPR